MEHLPSLGAEPPPPGGSLKEVIFHEREMPVGAVKDPVSLSVLIAAAEEGASWAAWKAK